MPNYPVATLDGLRIDNPRFPEILKTTQRVVLAHAWFEDEFLLPALKARPLVFEPFRQEIAREHGDIARLLARTVKSFPRARNALEADLLTLRVLLTTHFAKEEEGLFPLAEKVLGSKGLARMASAMERRKQEVRALPEVSLPKKRVRGG